MKHGNPDISRIPSTGENENSRSFEDGSPGLKKKRRGLHGGGGYSVGEGCISPISHPVSFNRDQL